MATKTKKTSKKPTTTKKRNGRPYAITKEKEEKIIELLSDGMSQAKVANYVGVNEKTIMEHRERFPEFAERIERAKEETTELAHKSVKVGMVRDWRAGAWWLERTDPERFQEKKSLEVNDKPSLIQNMFPIEDEETNNAN